MHTAIAQDMNVTATEDAQKLDLPNALKAGKREVMIPLRRLVASPYNQRKGKRDPATIGAIADNIRAVGLLQNLVVHPMRVRARQAQTFGVDAGETRRLALMLNVERGDFTLDDEVRCIEITEADAILASASENDLRAPVHPADQFVAYKALADQGRSTAFIAAVFKVTPRMVAGHLKLAAVSPKLFELFASDEMDLEQIQALAITDDHERQEAAWFGAQNSWNQEAHALRSVLRGDRLTFGDRMVRFVTVEAYEAAGGTVERDLFAERDEGFIVSNDILGRLFDEKIAASVQAVKAEGWAWTEARPKFEYGDRNSFTELDAEPNPLTDEQQSHLEALQRRSDEIYDRLGESDDAEEGDEARLSDDAYNELDKEQDRLTREIQTIEERDGVYTSEQMKVSGAIVTVDHRGELVVCRGLVRREDREEARAALQDSGASVPRDLSRKKKGVHSEKLLLNLTAHRTAAVQSALSQNPRVALVALTHRLALSYLYKGYDLDSLSAAQITRKETPHDMNRSAPEIKTTDHATGLREYVESWQAMLPKNPVLLFGWLLEQPQDRLLNLLAVCTALTINGVARDERPNAVNVVAGALDLNLSAYWQPTRTGYLDHVSKDRIATIVSQVVSKEEGARLTKMKKGEAAQVAEKLLTGKDWLPEFMSNAEVAPCTDQDATSGDNSLDCAVDDDDDHQSPDSALVTANADTSEGEENDHAVEGDAGAWQFPRAADFACEKSAGQFMQVQATAMLASRPAALSPASAWPFPTASSQSLMKSRRAA